MIQLKFSKLFPDSGHAFRLDVDLEFEEGKLLCITGPSGSGKSTLLNLIAGLIGPDHGRMTVGEKLWNDSESKIQLSPQERNIAFVFQDYALFPHLSVKENLLFGSKNETNSGNLNELLEVLNLKDLANSKPAVLSGGQQQRVALGRALMQEAEILLMDEPLSALDAEVRIKLQDYLLAYHLQNKCTIFMVSHDLEEIFKMADWVVQMKNGKLIRQGKPIELYGLAENDGQLSGKIMAIQKGENESSIQVLIGNQLLKISIDKDSLENMNIGDSVNVSSDSFTVKVKPDSISS